MSTDSKPQDGLVRWSRFLKELGVGPNTAAEWRRKGILKPTVNIQGYWYVKRSDIETFYQRAESGEFAGKIKKPTRKHP